MGPSTAALEDTATDARQLRRALPLLSVLVALGLLYLPTLQRLRRNHWALPEHSHGPLVLLAAAALFVAAGRRYLRLRPPAPEHIGAGALLLLLLGLLLHALGRVAEAVQFSLLALPPLLAGLSLLLGGRALLREQGWFVYFFLLFAIPWPSWASEPFTQPLKLAVSWATEQLLHRLAYPVARSGITLDIGGYRLLVADACAGMNSLFMLEAFGLLYLHLLRHSSALRNALLALLIMPISFGANVLRVLTLALLTFHFGDAVGQGLMHQFSGLLLFGAALALLAPLDALLRRLAARLKKR